MTPVFLLIGALLLPLPSALAQSGSGQELPGTVVDDSTITLQEIRRSSDRIFNALGGGNAVSRSQFVAADLPPEVVRSKPDAKALGRLFGLLDVDGNGQLSRAEWDAQIEKDLQFADQDGDGRVTLKELSNARENVGFGDAIGMLF